MTKLLSYFFILLTSIATAYSQNTVTEITRNNFKFKCITNGNVWFYADYSGRKVSISESYCYNTDESSFFTYVPNKSKKLLSDNTCSASLHQSEIDSPLGSYDFKLCKACKGQGQIVNFLDPETNEYIKTVRCIFADLSFVDTGILQLEGKIQITKE